MKSFAQSFAGQQGGFAIKKNVLDAEADVS